jgi:nifR3 family TIM-barrel protein
MFNHALQIGGLTIRHRAILAPLAGVTDVPFRRICREHGADLAYVEMLSARAVNYLSPRTIDMMARHADEERLGVQVTGATAEEVAEAAGLLEQRGFDAIDINMGCPVRKIVAKGWGSALLKNPDLIRSMVTATRGAVAIPVSVKCRLGYSSRELNVADTAVAVAQSGAQMLTIHGRTKMDDYSSPVDYSGIRIGVENAGDLVTVGNGDVLDAVSATRMVDETGCDAVMISRGALGNPWIFREILDGVEQHPVPEAWLDVVLRHLDYHEKHYGVSGHTTATARKHVLWYATGFPGARQFRNRISVIAEMHEMREQLRVYAHALPRDLKRHETPDLAAINPA